MSNVVSIPTGSRLVAAVAENIRAEAAIKGFNQSDLARALGWSPRTVSDRWWGGRQWQLEDIEQVAAVLKVPVQRLLDPARSEGFEPPTFWSVVEDATSCRVIDLFTRQEVA